jgi:uncharacterized repeat protein (TIGR01451 family)
MKKAKTIAIVLLLVLSFFLVPQAYALQVKNTWILFAEAPEGIGGGGDVVFYNNALYILRGGGSSDFWKLDIGSMLWTSLANLPDAAEWGASMAFDGERYIYVTKGSTFGGLGTSKEFWRYDTSQDHWEDLPDTPEGVTTIGSICFADGFVYLRTGASWPSNAFYRYSIDTQIWETKASGPIVWNTHGTPTVMTYDGIRYIYTFQGGHQLIPPGLDELLLDAIWRYDTLDNEWLELGHDEELERADLIYANGGLYALNEYSIYNFELFGLSTNAWKKLPDVPCGIGIWNSLGPGASLEFDGSRYIYALNGGNNKRIYRYCVSLVLGPDSFGYKCLDSNTPTGPTYDWIEISDTGTVVLPNSDDQWVVGINLGFFFNYYGTDYSQLAIGNNGLLFSGIGTSQYVNDPITQSPRIHGFIAPFWDDIVTWGSAGAIYYQTLGIAPNRKFVVEWYDNQHYSSSSSGITFEAILYEGTNNILFQYKDVDFGSVSGAVGGDNPPYDNGGSATVGIEDPTGTIGLQYSFNEQVITLGLAILFKFPPFTGTNMYLSMNAPASMDHGNTMTYTLYYNDFGDVAAQNVVLQAILSSNVDFVSASDGGTYDSPTRKVTWNIGTVPAFPSGRGSRTVTVTIPSSVPVGTVIQTEASISTTTLETRYDDNSASARTTVTGSSLPPNVGVGPILGNPGGTPSVYWTTPITFTYNAPTATGVDIRIHFDSGGPDITGSMTGGPPTWTHTTTFYPRTGHAAVTYTVLGTAGPIPALPSTIRVLRTATGQVEVVNFKDYVKNVLPNEWIPSWDMNALKAGAMAVKTYAWYWTIHQKYPGQNYDVKDSTADQVYVPGTSSPRTNQAVEETWNWVMTKTGEIFQAQYDSGTAGSPDPLYPGRMSQWGTQYWAETGKDWQWIVHYYYDPIEGPLVSSVTFGIYVDPAGYIYDVSTDERISGATVWLQRPDGEGDWENVPTGQIPAIMQPDVNPQVTGADGQYQWDVLEGSYRVHVEAPGYYPADSIVVNIPPPVTDLHVGLTQLPPPPDPIPPTTTLTIGDPKYTDPSGNVYVTSATPITLLAEDNVDGSGVATTGYRIRNEAYNFGWTATAPPIEFYLTGLADGLYFIDYNSTDNVGNIESTQTNSTTLDNSGPLIIVENPHAGWALQGGVTFIASASDLSGTHSLNFSIREANGGQGIPVGFEDIPATYDAITGRWNWYFNTLQLPDGYYIVLVNAEDNLGHTASTTVPYSIRNWAVLKLLPATQNNKAGRTMPVKFALRVNASVDPNQPFVYNEELTITIYATSNPSNILQTSTFGDTARDYRIISVSELYITNFQTLKTPMQYRVSVYRGTFRIDYFSFATVK